MKRLVLIAALFLFAGISHATFELDDPAEDVGQTNNEAKGEPDEQVIVPVGTNLYAPSIVQGECEGWLFDESEYSLEDSNDKQFTTQTTYIGVIIKIIDCKNEVDGGTLRFALVRVEKSRLIWVELGRVLSAG